MNALSTDKRAATVLGTGALCAVVVVAPQLFGGAFPWTVTAIAGLALAAFGVAFWVRYADPPPVIDAVWVAMSVAWLWTCLQALPLPSALAEALGLASVESAARLEDLAWVSPPAMTISYEPGQTHIQVLIGVGILSAFLAARLLGKAQLRPLAAATVASATLMGIVGLAHELSGSVSLFGTYVPRFTATRLVAPLMNGNHLAGFLMLGALVASGLAYEARRGPNRALWIAAACFCTGVMAWTLSRGALGATLAGFLLFSAWLVVRRRSSYRRAIIPVAVSVATFAGIVLFASLEPILRRFETADFDKIEVGLRGFTLLEGSAWVFGIGRGAFSSMFVALEGTSDRYTHPENLIVQWTTEWGVPIALLVLLVVGSALWKRFRSTDQPVVAAVSIGVFALAAQNLVDFSLEMAGVVVVVAALLGALLPVEGRPPWAGISKLLAALFVVFAATLAMLGPRVIEIDTQSIVDRLTGYIEADDEERFVAALRRGIRLHPGEPSIALLAGAYAAAKRHPDAGRWLSIVMDEAPDWGMPHAIAAGLLEAEGNIDQALLEVREAERRRAGSAADVVCRILAQSPTTDQLHRAAPPDDAGTAFFNRATRCAGLPAWTSAEIDQVILQRSPTHVDASLRESKRLIDNDGKAEAVDLLEKSLAANPDEVRIWKALIRAHLANDDPSQAMSLIEESGASGLDSRIVQEAKARIEAASGDADAMRATVTRLRGSAQGDRALVAKSFILQGELEASMGNVDEALSAYEAADSADHSTNALYRAARLALASGRHTYARAIYRTLCRRDPEGPACAQVARLVDDPARTPVGRVVP